VKCPLCARSNIVMSLKAPTSAPGSGAPKLAPVLADEGFILDWNRLHGSGRIVHDVLVTC
jgi:hypothetical protein